MRRLAVLDHRDELLVVAVLLGSRPRLDDDATEHHLRRTTGLDVDGVVRALREAPRRRPAHWLVGDVDGADVDGAEVAERAEPSSASATASPATAEPAR